MTRLQRLPILLALVLALLGVSAGVLDRWETGARATNEVVVRSVQSGASESAAPAPAVVVSARLVPWGPTPNRLAASAPAPAIGGTAAIVLDEASGVVLYEKDAHARLPEASLTKIMTALLAIEHGNLDEQVDVQVDSRIMRGSTVMGLVPGERLTVDDLLYGLLLPSGNDAALAIAQHVSGSTEAFVALMNKRAGELGLVDTHFANPHGLDASGHYSSAYDLAVLTRTAMQLPEFRTIVNTRYRVVRGTLSTYQLGTLNPLYGRLAGVDGVKTGYTRTARQTLVGSVMRDGHRVYAVVMRSEDRASDGVALFNWTFDSYTWAGPTTVASDITTTAPGT